MDRVRLGRVLGRGARLAARTAYEALDAATADAPAGQRTPRTAQPARGDVLPPARPAAQARVAAVTAARSASAQGRVSGFVSPLRRATRAVSLQVTGSFFALFALPFVLAVWKEREGLHAGPQGIARFCLVCGVAGFFLYASVRSFLRARKV